MESNVDDNVEIDEVGRQAWICSNNIIIPDLDAGLRGPKR